MNVETISKNDVGQFKTRITEVSAGGKRWLCGYLGVPPGTPWHGKDHGDIDADVHGGLSFSGRFDDDPEVWFVGFDCMHYGDNRVTCDTAFVTQEIAALLRQAEAAK